MIYDSSNNKPGLLSSLMQLGILSVMKSPVVSTLLLFLAGALFAGVIMMSYPDPADEGARVPILKADSAQVKTVPDDRGGMPIPNQDSTVFQAMRGDIGDRPVVENLLAPSTTDSLPPEPLIDLSVNSKDKGESPTAKDLTAPISEEPKVKPETEPPVADTKLAQKSQQDEKTPEVKAKEAETMEYVRSVLKEEPPKEQAKPAEKPKPVQKKPVKTTAPVSKTPGSYYVQIASVKSESAAHAEWKKTQKKYSVLSGVDYRVKRADLGAKGVYYRIQAGGLSKASADSLCKAIKAKSGGCFVVK